MTRRERAKKVAADTEAARQWVEGDRAARGIMTVELTRENIEAIAEAAPDVRPRRQHADVHGLGRAGAERVHVHMSDEVGGVGIALGARATHFPTRTK